MGWTATPLALLGFSAAAVSAVVAGAAWRQRSEPGSWPFFGMIACLTVWSLCYGIQYGTTEPVLVWQRLGLAAGGFVPPLWLLFCVQYAGRMERVRPRVATALAIEPLAFLALIGTNDSHGLLWSDADVVYTGSAFVADVSLAQGYFLHYAYAYLLLGGGFAVLLSVFVEGSRLSQKQTGLLMLGTLPAVVMNTAFTFDLAWGPLPTFDATPFAFVLTAVLFGLALFQFDLLERTPTARRHVIDEMGDGLLVLDAEGRVEDTNETARRVVDPTPTSGDDITDIVSVSASSASDACEQIDGKTVTVTVDGQERAYDVDCDTLRGHADQLAGYVVALRDVTERRQYEQRLEVAQRVLRHNIRNDLTVVKGWADELTEHVDGERAEVGVERIRAAADDLVDLSEKTRTMVELDEYDANDRRQVDVADVVAETVEAFEAGRPDASITVDTPSETGVAVLSVPSAAFVSVPVENLVENAVEHNDEAAPTVTVSVTVVDDEVRVAVADDCPEIPAVERRVLDEGDEDPLTHGSGIGLWLTYWAVSEVGGDVRFDTRAPRGNVVTLAYPPTGE
jgi:signal transduction histidine kinase